MWRVLVVLLCAAVSFGFSSNTPGGGGISGGTCTGGQFMSGISSSGAPICSTPSGGAPFPPGNVPQIAGYSALNTAEAWTVSGGNSGCTYSRTGTGAASLNCTLLAPLASPTFTGTLTAANVTITGTLALPNASVTDANLASAYSGVGACGAGLFASTLSRNAAPTCTQPAAANISGLGALATLNVGTGLTSSGGNLNLTVPVAVGSGGLGGTVAPTAGQLLMAQSATLYAPVTVNCPANQTMNAIGAGGTVCLPTGTVTSITAGTGLTGGTINTTGTIALGTNPAGGQLNYAPLASPTFTGTVTMPDASTFTSAGHNSAKAIGIGMAAPSTTGDLALSNTASSSVYWGSTTTPTGTLLALNNALYLIGGGHYNGTNWIADATNSGMFAAGPTNTVYANSGLTVGNSFAPTAVLQVAPSGANLLVGTYQVNGTQIATTNLGDYSTGSWTPAIAFNGSATGWAWTTYGQYVKVGKLVFCQFNLSCTTKGTATGVMQMTGLPFTTYSSTNVYSTGSPLNYGNFVGLTGNQLIVFFNPISNTTYGQFLATNVAAGAIQIQDPQIQAGTGMGGSFSYIAQ